MIRVLCRKYPPLFVRDPTEHTTTANNKYIVPSISLGKEAVGGLRTCYFDGGNLSNADFGGGTIVEKITALERGKVLRMDVIEYALVGRKWLGFKEAIYYFEKSGTGGCRLTRITTYTSVLTPRWYWEPMERLGIQQEHEYVFNNLAKDLERMYGR